MPEQTLKTEYGVVARASRPGPLPFVLKHAETFAVFDPIGDVHPLAGGDLGVFREGTRHVSHLELRPWGHRPLLLSSTVREDNCLLVAHLTNPDLPGLPQGTVHIQRSSVLDDAACLQQLSVTSYAEDEIEIPLVLRFDADFRDVFEVRGMTRARRGDRRRTAMDGVVRVSYLGLDGRDRVSLLRADRALTPAGEDALSVTVRAPARTTVRLCLSIDFREPPAEGAHAGESVSERFDRAVGRALAKYRAARRDAAQVTTSNEQFNSWINRSFSDIHMLATENGSGLFPYAGVPWYSTPFGRDGLITARQMLVVQPNLARGVLGYLAEHQATEEDPENDAEPGKILHEARLGEMAALREVPFGKYYGSIDSTPLFLMLAGDYLRRTSDAAFVRSLWPSLQRAAEWILRWGDRDGNGLISYARRTDAGLRNQGWKDSEDSVFHEDGTLAEGAIAMCEVQAYACAGLRAAESIARAFGDDRHAAAYGREAERIRAVLDERFWLPDKQTYALAIDGEGRACSVRSSNAGHVLWACAVDPERAAGVARSLMSPSSFCGWGVRTIDEGERRFNPMSYHNGSIWPHDNALIALGLARHGFKPEAVRIMTGLFDASIFMPMHRLPELFGGFARREDEGPTLYPVACMPQAWASGAVFALLEACTGLSVFTEAATGRPTVRFTNPVLPAYLEHVHIAGLRVGDEEVDIELHRYATDVGVNTTRRSPRVDVVITK